jgi:hypothetical protein
METPSEEINYKLAEEQIAQTVIDSFRDAPAEHDLCLFRFTPEDYSGLDCQRISQLIQDGLGEEISWREMPREEVIVNGGSDIGDNKLVVFKRGEDKEEEEENNG